MARCIGWAKGLGVFCTVIVPISGSLHAQSKASDVPGQGNASADITLSDMTLQPQPAHPGIAFGYFTITNHGAETHLLTGITSSACRDVIARHTAQEVNEHTSGLFTHLALPRHVMMVFAPGGYHFVCLGLQDGTHDGDVPVTFTFLGGSQQTVSFPIRSGENDD